jgi:hypothetical protein
MNGKNGSCKCTLCDKGSKPIAVSNIASSFKPRGSRGGPRGPREIILRDVSENLGAITEASTTF